MRIAMPMRRRVLWGALTAAALLALLPLRLLLGAPPFADAGFSARAVGGPVWMGRIAELRWRGIALGDVDARLQVLPLLLGRVRVALDGVHTTGAVIASPGSVGIEDLDGRFVIDGALPGLPIRALSAHRLTVRFADGACLRASGRVTADLDAGTGMSAGQALTGAVRCEGAALLLPLSGATALDRVEIAIDGDGRWTARMATGGAQGARLERAGRL